MTTDTASRWTLQSAGNRIMWAVIAAFVTWFVLHAGPPALVVGAVTFGILTAVAAARR